MASGHVNRIKSAGSANELHQQGGVFVKSWWWRWPENY